MSVYDRPSSRFHDAEQRAPSGLRASNARFQHYEAEGTPGYVAMLRRQRATVWSDRAASVAPLYDDKKRMLVAQMRRTLTADNASHLQRRPEAAPQYSTRIPRLSETEARDSDSDSDTRPDISRPRVSLQLSSPEPGYRMSLVPESLGKASPQSERRRTLSNTSLQSVEESFAQQRLFIANPDMSENEDSN